MPYPPPIGVATLSAEGKILAWNRDAEHLLERTGEDALGAFFPLFFLPDEQKRLSDFISRCGAAGESCPPEIFARLKGDGSPQRIEIRVTAITGGARGDRGLVLLRDVTDEDEAEEALREETRVVETINRVGQTLAGELDLQKLVQSLTDAATEITGAQFGAFFYNVLNAQGESYMLYTLSGVPREAFSNFPMPRNTLVFDPTFKGDGIIRSDDITQDPRYGKNDPHYGMPEGHLPVRSYLAIPVTSRSGVVLGGLFFGHAETGIFTERHERILVGIASQAAVAVDNARLYQQARDAEERLRQQLDFNSAITHNMGEGIYTLDAEGRVTFLNPAAERMLGWKEAELRGRNIHDAIHYQDSEGRRLPAESCPLLGVLRSRRVIFNDEDTFIRKDGSPFPVSVTSSPILEEGEVTGAVLSFRDLTERKRAEEEMRDLAAHARCILWSAEVEDVGERFKWAFTLPDEEGAQQILPLDIPPGDTYTHMWLKCRHDDDRARILQVSNEAIFTGKPTYNQEYRCIDRYGQTRWIFEDVKLEPLGPGRWRAFGVCTDVSEQRHTEEALKQSEYKLRALFENTTEAILIADDSGAYRDANPAASEVIGIPLGEIVGRNVLDFALEEDREEVRQSWAQFLRDGRQEGEFPLYRPDGTMRYLEYKARANFLPGMHLSVLRDVTERKQMEVALQQRAAALAEANRQNEETVALLDTLLANAPIGFAFFDREYRFVRVNQFLAEINGMSIAEHLGRTVRDLVPVNADPVEPILERVFATGEPALNVEIEGETPAEPGERRHWLTGFYPVFTSEGEMPWVGALVTDITERKGIENALRNSEEQFRTLVEQSPLSVQVMSSDGWTLQVNRAWEKLWGITLDQIAGYNILRDRQLVEKGIMPYIELAFSGEATEVPPVLYNKRETLPHIPPGEHPEVWVRAFIYPVRDQAGEITKVVLIHEDYSERKTLEDELRQRAEELAEEAKRKDNFLNMLAHELRNPLAPILSAVHIIKMIGGAEPPLLRARDVVERQVNHMARLIDELLELSRINQGKITLQKRRVMLADVFEGAAQSVRPLLDARYHELKVALPDAPISLDADPIRLEQILTNLLENAAKYTDPGGRIDLIGERGDGEVVLRVRDTGVGMGPDLLPHIFDLFSQADITLDRPKGGLGLGLPLVKNLVALHGGTVEAYSRGAGQGSEFVVRLPALPDETPAVQERPVLHAPLAQASMKVLVVEDNADGREMLKNLLEMWGHRLAVAEDGLRGVEAAQADPPEVALIDIGLPALDGYGVARQLRATLGERCPFLVALTGYGQAEAQRLVKEAGFDAHLVKPVDPAELRRLLIGVGGR